MLHIAIVHHHLRGGGVTRVISNAAEALRERKVNLAVLVGEPPATDMPENVTVEVVPGLGYANAADSSAVSSDSGQLLSRIKAAAGRVFGQPPDVWHIHNHCLGKNPGFTHAVYQLAAEQAPLVLQVHDFAEDGRPENYRSLHEALQNLAPKTGLNCLYPAGGRVHYALLNQRDSRTLANAGLPENRNHILANTVFLESPPEKAVKRSSDFIVYPSRAIRRKNLGEFLLWALAAADYRFAVTLAPKNPDARPVYEAWVQQAATLRLPLSFEYAQETDLPFPQVLSSAAAVGTTSVGEGFGLAFLEPWLTGTPVLGRDLPEITQDFKRQGIDLQALYSRLDVPVKWVTHDALRATFAREMANSWQSYQRELTAATVDRAVDSAVRDGDLVDFGRLDEALQQKVLETLKDDEPWQSRLRDHVFGSLDDAASRADENRRRIQKHFGLHAYGEKIEALYRDTAASASTPVYSLDPQKVLDAFLNPDSFMLLRT